DLIPLNYDSYPLSYRTYISWYNIRSDLDCMWDFYRYNDYDYPTMKQLTIPIQILIGDADDVVFIPKLNSTLETTIKTLRDNIKNLDLNIIKGSGHTFVGFENEVVEIIKRFLQD